MVGATVRLFSATPGLSGRSMQHNGASNQVILSGSALAAGVTTNRWMINNGLFGSGTITFHPVDFTSKCLRHSGNALWIHDCSTLTTNGAKQDASFLVVPGWVMADQGYVSFQSDNFPTSYIRHSASMMINNVVSASSTSVLKADASWRAELV